jgi:hypothetical protein
MNHPYCKGIGEIKKLSERDEEINRTKRIATSSLDEKVKTDTIDALEPYGEDGISSIAEIIETTTYSKVRSHGLEVIRRIRAKNKTESRKLYPEEVIEGDPE